MAPDAAAADSGGASVAKRDFWSCLSCRLLSGTGLIGAGVWVFLQPYRLMKQRIPPGLWQMTQMTFAVAVMSWGFVVIVDPVEKKK